MFRRWLRAEHPQPYGSFGNGSAMRVAAAGWLFDTLDKTLEMAKVTAEVTHNQPEGIKGVQATAAAFFFGTHRPQQAGDPAVCGADLRLRFEPHLR